MATLTDSTTASQNASNQVTTQHYGATARWGGASILTLEGAYAHNKVTYSEQSSSDSNSDTASVGLYYRVGPALRLGSPASKHSEQHKGDWKDFLAGGQEAMQSIQK